MFERVRSMFSGEATPSERVYQKLLTAPHDVTSATISSRAAEELKADMARMSNREPHEMPPVNGLQFNGLKLNVDETQRQDVVIGDPDAEEETRIL